MQLYRYSPIKSEAELKEAIQYIVTQEEKLAIKAVGVTLPITYLTVFAHYDDEYRQLVGIVEGWGSVSEANNGVKVKMQKPLQVQGQSIDGLRIRKPDPYRMQVGCCDLSVDNYSAFKAANLSQDSNLRLIERTEYEMIEFFDPDFDVLAYIVSR